MLSAVLGVTFLIVGVLGFAMGGMHQLFSVQGTDLIVFSLNPFHNVLHLLLGGLFLAISIRPRRPFAIGASFGVAVLMVLAVVGSLMEGGQLLNRLAANSADNAFHAITAFVAFGAAAWAANTAPRHR